jgi:hypothetical protein
MIPLASDLLPFPDQMRREDLMKFASSLLRLSSSGRIVIVGTVSQKSLEGFNFPLDIHEFSTGWKFMKSR